MVVTLVFLALALVGLIFIIVSVFLGHDLGHELEAGADISGGGPSAFSVRTFAVFLTSFGAVGAVTSYYLEAQRGAGAISSLLGLLSGLLLSGIYLVAMRMIYSQQASSLVADRDLVGAEARVTVAIPENGVGEVSCSIGVQTTRRTARGHGRQAIPEGAIVRVKEVYGDTVVVEVVA